MSNFKITNWLISVPILQQPTHSLQNNSVQSITHIAKFTPQSIVVYKHFEGFARRKKTAQELANLEKGKKGEYNGRMSPATTRKVKSLLENWLLSLEVAITKNWTVPMQKAMRDKSIKKEYAPTFVTLTLPAKQFHSDNEIKRLMLNRFILEVTRKHKVKHYFWRAEPQKNGNIHFHIIIDKYIHYQIVRSIWNKILDDYGYIEAYRKNQYSKHKNGFSLDRKQLDMYIQNTKVFLAEAGKKIDVKRIRQDGIDKQIKAYDLGIKCDFSNPNSTDIHAIEKVQSITSYVVKYVCKDSNILEKNEHGEEVYLYRKIDGRIWGCTDELRTLKHFESEVAIRQDYVTVTRQCEENQLINALVATSKQENIIHKEDAGILIILLEKRELMRELLRANFPCLYNSYVTHYQMNYIFLYKQEEFVALALFNALLSK